MGAAPTIDDGTSASGTWFELTVSADQEAVEAVSEILSEVAPGGVSVEVPFATEQEGLTSRPLMDAPATVRAYLPGLDARAAEASIARVRERLGHLTVFGLRPIGELEVSTVHDEDWASAWKAHFPVMRVGRRIVIRPTWRDHDPQPDDIVIALDPGMAFGTGLHPTTRLCLTGLEAWDEAGLVRGARALDVGSGSGILAIGAALLGARPVVAVDTDPVAIESTALNAERNRVELDTRLGSVPVEDGPFGIVFANLVASLLIETSEALAEVLGQGGLESGGGGRLLASGIFIDREPEVIEAFREAGLHVVGRWTETDWVALDLEGRAS